MSKLNIYRVKDDLHVDSKGKKYSNAVTIVQNYIKEVFGRHDYEPGCYAAKVNQTGEQYTFKDGNFVLESECVIEQTYPNLFKWNKKTEKEFIDGLKASFESF